MGVSWVENDEDVFTRLAKRREANTYRQQNVSNQFASLLASYESAYPEANPGVKMALARLGLPVNSEQAQKIIAMQHEDSKGKGLLDRFGDVVGGAAHLVDRATGPVGDVLATGAKGLTRAAFVALETPLQEVQNFSRAALYESLSHVGGRGNSGLSGMNRSFGNTLAHAGTSSGREALSDLFDGDKVDLGTGILPGGKIEHEVRQRAGELELDFGNAHFGGPNGQAITLGRVTAATVFEPGTWQYGASSGLVDGLVAWFGDPAAAAGSLAKEAQASARLQRGVRAAVDERSLARGITELAVKPNLARIADDSLHGRAIERVAGMIPGHRPTTIPERTESFLTKEFAPAIVKIAEERDALTMYRKFGGKVPMRLVREMADETDPQKVRQILSGNLGGAVSELPEYLGYRARRGNKKGVRLLDRMPGQYVDPDDLDDVFTNVELSLRNMRLQPEMRDTLLRKVIDNEDRSTLVSTLASVFEDAAEDMVGRIKPRGAVRQITRKADETAEEFAARQAGEVSKVAKDRARGLVRMFKEDTEQLRAYVGDEIVSGDKAVGLVIDGTAIPAGSPYTLSELLNSGIPLPDARDVRQATSRIASLVDNPLFERTDDVLSSLTRGWKQMTLLRPAYAVRVLGEEMVRMTASGLDTVLNHPINYIAALVMNPKAAEKFAASAARKGLDSDRAANLSPHGRIRQFSPSGERYYDEDMLPTSQELSDAVNKSASNLADIRLARERHYDIIPQAHPAFKQAWHNSLGEINKDDIWRKVAESNGNLETVEMFLWSEAGQGLRMELHRANPELMLHTPEGVTTYVQNLHRQLLRRTGGDPETIMAVATGLWNGKAIGKMDRQGKFRLDDDFSAHLDHVSPPDTVKGQKLMRSDRAQEGHWNRFMDVAFDHLMTRNTNYLHRNPTYRQLDWNAFEDMMPFMDDTLRAQVLENAAKAGGASKRQLARMRQIDSAIPKAPQEFDTVVRFEETPFAQLSGGDVVPPLYHGTSRVLPEGRLRQGSMYERTISGNLYGPGLYSTDDAAMGATYMNKGAGKAKPFSSYKHRITKEPGEDFQTFAARADDDIRAQMAEDRARKGAVYSVAWEGDHAPRVLDLNATLPPEAGLRFEEISRGLPDDAGEELAQTIGSMSGVEAYAALKRAMRDVEGLPTSEADEIIGQLNEALADDFDALLHTGGIKGGKKHNVYIWLNEGDVAAARHAPTVTIPRAGKQRGSITSMEDAAFIAKKRALNGTKQLLYDMSEKSQFFDAMHLVIPFGEAWKEVLTRWAHLAAENPKVVRRAQQVIVAARGNTEANDGRGNGFFHKDTFGDEVFTMPFSRNIAKMTTGIPIDLTGRVAGLSLMADILPGVGPVLQIPAAAILPNTPTWDFARDLIMPFGAEDYSGGIFESALPQWAQRLKSAFGKGDPVKYAATVSDVTNYLSSTGEYNLNDPESATKLVEDANKIAQKVEFFRAMGSAVSPTSPTAQFLSKTKGEYGEHMVLAKVLADDFWKLVEDPKFGYDGAVEEFVSRYGKDAFLGTQGKTFAIVPHQAMGKATGEWEREHQGLVKKFPLVWGLFAPGEENEEDFDFDVRKRQIDRGERKYLTPAQRIAMAQRTLGSHIVKVAEARLGDNPSKRGREWLAYIKERVREEYPDYGRSVAGLPAKYDTDTVVEQLGRAINDPALSKTKQATAARLYMTARQNVLDALVADGAVARGDSGALGTQAAEPGRAWLASYSRKVLAKYPEFRAFFDAVFSRELDA